jgi:hypothetical protein
LGNDNSVTGYADQSDIAPANTSAAHNGAQGAQGSKGDTGLPGPNKILSVRIQSSRVVDIPPRGIVKVDAVCAPDEHVAGGGPAFSNGATVIESIPVSDNAWEIVVASNDDFLFSGGIRVWASCIKLA